MRIKLNAHFTIDNTQLAPGEHEVTQAQYEMMKGIDIKGMPIITNEQIPLISPVDNTPADED